MMTIYRLLYSLIFILVLPLGLLFSKKLRKYFATRMQDHTGATIPHLSKKIILIHAASGEAEYAFPVAEKIKKQNPDSFIVFSYYSPSYVAKIKAHPKVDLALPLPLDFPGAVHSFLSYIKPEMILISRTDLWPEFINQSHRRKIPIVLFSRTEQAKKGPLRSAVKRWIYKKLSMISVVADEDLKNVEAILGRTNKNLKDPKTRSEKPSLLCHGDTRWDQVFNKALPLKSESFLPHAFFVAGSAWPEDLKPLLEAWSKDLGILVIAPHEIHETQMKDLENRLDYLNFKPRRYSQIKNDLTQLKNLEGAVLLIDELGVLYKSYMGAYGALIGGSYKRKVHSVMEALACQTPVVVGPYYHNNREATNYIDKPLWGDPKGSGIVQEARSTQSLSQSLMGLHQRYLMITKEEFLRPGTPIDDRGSKIQSAYLKKIWDNPICLETAHSPSQELVDSLLTV